MNKLEPLPPRYHITDALWNSFTVEGVNKTIDALGKRGDLRHPEAFTERLSGKALWDTDPDFFEETLKEFETQYDMTAARPGHLTDDGQLRLHSWQHNGTLRRHNSYNKTLPTRSPAAATR